MPPSSPSQASDTVNGHTAARVIAELGLQQAQPVLHHLPGRGRPVIKGPVLWRAEAREAGRLGPVSPWPGQGRHSGKHGGTPRGGGTAGPRGQSAGQACSPHGKASHASPADFFGPLLQEALPEHPSSSLLSTVSPSSPPCQPTLSLQGHSLTLTNLNVSESAGPRGLGSKRGGYVHPPGPSPQPHRTKQAQPGYPLGRSEGRVVG